MSATLPPARSQTGTGREVTSALARLTSYAVDAAAVATHARDDGRLIVGLTSNTVPWEIVEAAGAFPLLLPADGTPSRGADRFMEPVFERRIRSLFAAIVQGEWRSLALLVLPRTSEGEHKLFLYLREVQRQMPDAPIPPVWLYDLLHSRSTRARAYGRTRTVALATRLGELTGHAISYAALNAAIARGDRARTALRRILALRQSRPRLTGVEAHAIVAAFHSMDRDAFAGTARDAYDEVRRRAPLPGPRLMISGASPSRPDLHRALESAGAVVVAEDDWRGSRAAGRDVGVGEDPLARIFRKYYEDAPGPRVFPPALADRWFVRESARGIDGVVHYLPKEDDVCGWDYPRRRALLDSRGIPSLVVHEDVSDGVSDDLRQRLAAFVRALPAGRVEAAR